MRILWVSNGRKTHTGYGVQTNLFAPQFQAAGHQVAVFAYYGQEGAGSIDPEGIVTLPRWGDAWGNDIALSHYNWFKADAAITLVNPWVLDPEIYRQMNWIAWAPVEGYPVYPGDVAALKFAKRIWAMSRDGEQRFQEAGFTNVDYVPHGVDLDVFKPVDRTEARKWFEKMSGRSIEGRFLVVYNAANKGAAGRKGWYECLAGFKEFKEAMPNCKPLLYLHTDRSGRWGVPLDVVMQMTGLNDEDVVFVPQYHYATGMIPPTHLNLIYNAADVYLHTAYAEGFGIPILEAQAAGCPAIVNDFGTMGELIFDGSYHLLNGTKFMPTFGQVQKIPDVEEIAHELEWVSAQVHRRDEKAERLHEQARQYDHKLVFEQYMLPALEKAAAGWVKPKVKVEAKAVLDAVGGD